MVATASLDEYTIVESTTKLIEQAFILQIYTGTLPSMFRCYVLYSRYVSYQQMVQNVETEQSSLVSWAQLMRHYLKM
jgi:hypothetical protein